MTLEYRLYGYVSMIAVASAYPDIFHCVRRNSSDFLLFDAQQPLPECYTRNLNFGLYILILYYNVTLINLHIVCIVKY